MDLAPPKGAAPQADAKPGDPATAEERVVRCRRCGHPLALEKDRQPIDGAPSATFVNPHGLVFEIARFARADGCAAEGERSTVWTWFPGHAWQIAACAKCGAHVGWAFVGPSSFFGLLVERIA